MAKQVDSIINANIPLLKTFGLQSEIFAISISISLNNVSKLNLPLRMLLKT
jgi:hypothetical protein